MLFRSVDAVETATVLPVDFQGRWGLVANDCDPARDDNKGLMTVAADTLKFYESRGVVKTVTIASPTKLTADLAFTGEGQRSEEHTSELQSLMRNPFAVFCFQKKTNKT